MVSPFFPLSPCEFSQQRRNAGIVLLLVPLQNHEPGTGHIRIEVGQGLEGVITDATAGRIRELIRPDLVREQYARALTTAVETIASTSGADTGTTLRYSDGIYLYNLATRSLADMTATYEIRITGPFATVTTLFGTRAK